jgi:hypothetical protein
MIPKKPSKLEINTRKWVLKMEAMGDLSSREARKEIFKQFPVHNDQAIAAAKIRIIQKYAQIYHEASDHLKLDDPIFDKYAK